MHTSVSQQKTLLFGFEQVPSGSCQSYSHSLTKVERFCTILAAQICVHLNVRVTLSVNL